MFNGYYLLLYSVHYTLCVNNNNNNNNNNASGKCHYYFCWDDDYYIVEAATIMKDIVDAVAYLHSQGIAHRDVKVSILYIYRTKQCITWSNVLFD